MKPITTDGMASSSSGAVTTQGDSWGSWWWSSWPWPWIVVVGVRVLVEALLAMEHQEIHAERIERRDEHARQHGEVGEAGSGQVTFSTASMMLSLE
jgi:hypothetical protein